MRTPVDNLLSVRAAWEERGKVQRLAWGACEVLPFTLATKEGGGIEVSIPAPSVIELFVHSASQVGDF